MRVNWNIIKLFLLLVLVVFLYAFSGNKNALRKIETINIKFLDNSQPFLTESTVSKLLIQNKQSVTSVPKEILDLNELENALKSNKIIKNAEVYLSVNGQLTAEIEQKQPIARVYTNASYYIDDEGSFMPLSTNYSARVPLVTGNVEKNDLQTVYKVAKKIQEDTILRKHVVEIHQNRDKTIHLKFRQQDFNVDLGNLKQLDKKFDNLKAFYNKALKDKTLNSYSNVNLQFDNQVVCTKK